MIFFNVLLDSVVSLELGANVLIPFPDSYCGYCYNFDPLYPLIYPIQVLVLMWLQIPFMPQLFLLTCSSRFTELSQEVGPTSEPNPRTSSPPQGRAWLTPTLFYYTSFKIWKCPHGQKFKHASRQIDAYNATTNSFLSSITTTHPALAKAISRHFFWKQSLYVYS